MDNALRARVLGKIHVKVMGSPSKNSHVNKQHFAKMHFIGIKIRIHNP